MSYIERAQPGGVSREAHSIVPDWTRERARHSRDYGSRLLRSLRAHENAVRRGGLVGAVARRYWALSHRFWSVVTQSEVHLGTRIGGGLLLVHASGIVIHPSVEIGCNCLIFHQVTLGSNGKGVPRIGNHVDIGAGAKIIGPVSIGDHAIIGANAVVLQDVPPGATAVGVPARVILANSGARLQRLSRREGASGHG